MKKNDLVRLKEEIYSISKKIVSEKFPEELEFFEDVWKVMQYLLSKWKDVNPEKWPIYESRERLMTGLGFSDPAEMPDITAPIIIGVLAATFWHIGTLREDPKPEEIVRIIGDYSRRFGASKEVKNKLKEFVFSAGMASLIKREIIGTEEEKEYDVYIEGELKPMTRNEVETLEADKNEYLAWVWVDDERSEIIVDKEKRDIKPDSIAFKFLREILKSIGKDLPHETIYNEVPEIKKGNLHQNLNKLKEKTNHVLDDYISGEKRFRFSISKFKSCMIIKRDK